VCPACAQLVPCCALPPPPLFLSAVCIVRRVPSLTLPWATTLRVSCVGVPQQQQRRWPQGLPKRRRGAVPASVVPPVPPPPTSPATATAAAALRSVEAAAGRAVPPPPRCPLATLAAGAQSWSRHRVLQPLPLLRWVPGACGCLACGSVSRFCTLALVRGPCFLSSFAFALPACNTVGALTCRGRGHAFSTPPSFFLSCPNRWLPPRAPWGGGRAPSALVWTSFFGGLAHVRAVVRVTPNLTPSIECPPGAFSGCRWRWSTGAAVCVCVCDCSTHRVS
jgi:hypothetical protein